MHTRLFAFMHYITLLQIILGVLQNIVRKTEAVSMRSSMSMSGIPNQQGCRTSCATGLSAPNP